jgi:hypothetical protein
VELNQLDVVHRVRLLDVGAEIEVVEHLMPYHARVIERGEKGEKLREQSMLSA